MTWERDEEPYDLVQFLTDARIEAVALQGWRPEATVAERAIRELEGTVVDRDRLEAAVRRLPRESKSQVTSLTELTDEEFDALMDKGFNGLYALAPAAFLRLVANSLNLMVIHEVVLDELPTYWRTVIRRSSPVQPMFPLTPTHEPVLATLDRPGTSSRWAVEVWIDDVSSPGPGVGASSVAVELELKPDTLTAKLLIELIDPAPMPTSQCRASVADRELREYGRYEGPADAIEVPLEGWDGRTKLYLSCEVDRTVSERYTFVTPVRLY